MFTTIKKERKINTNQLNILVINLDQVIPWTNTSICTSYAWFGLRRWIAQQLSLNIREKCTLVQRLHLHMAMKTWWRIFSNSYINIFTDTKLMMMKNIFCHKYRRTTKDVKNGKIKQKNKPSLTLTLFDSLALDTDKTKSFCFPISTDILVMSTTFR